MKPFNLFLLAGLNSFFILTGHAQMSKDSSETYPLQDSVTMSAGPQFAASKSKQFWWGKHWRDEWTTPVTFPVFNIDTTAGGLTPLKMGGGHETKTLRLRGGNGREYVLRTIDKSLDVLIPGEFKESYISDVVNDQISTAHPYGPLVAAQLAAHAGLLHTNPRIFFVPSNARLGEFQSTFGNKLCLFEERSNGDGWEHTAITGYADDIINSEKLSEKLIEDNRNSVDAKEYLKARFVDMLINDWDRHEDQWVWGEHKQGENIIYEPFPRDHDQSFSRTDGVYLHFISRPWALRSIQDLKPNIKDVIGTNLSATRLDRRLTTGLSKDDWMAAIHSVQSSLTDSVIRKCLQVMPQNIYDMSGEFLFNTLRDRRNNMEDFGMKYYRILNRNIDLAGSNKKEIFTINKSNDATEITIQAVDVNDNAADTLFHRVFDPGITSSINIYGMAGNDKFIFTATGNNSMRIRSFGEEGNDAYVDNSLNNISRISAYDATGDKPASSTQLSYHSTTDTSIVNFNPKKFKYDWYKPSFFPGYNADDGILLRAGIIYRKQKWHKTPYGWEQSVGATYAIATGAYTIFYNGIFKQAFGSWDFNLAAHYNAPSYVVNFYGFGNDTKLSNGEKRFYRVRATSFFINPSTSKSWKNNIFKTGLFFNTVKVDRTENKFIAGAIPGVDSTVFNTKYFAGANVSITLNTADNLRNPTKGVNFQVGSAYTMNLENKNNFLNLQSSFTFYLTPIHGITIAHRTGAATNIGDYEFYQANTLGSHENLRGYWRTRFTGKSTFYQNTDVRIKLADLKGYFFRGTLGIYGFFDDGRIWDDADLSDDLHTGYGGGLYFLPYNRLAINLSYGVSTEANVFMIRTGFLF